MDITTLAALGEFPGGIAVIPSLLYLASQVWSIWRGSFADSFQDFVDGLIREAEAAR